MTLEHDKRSTVERVELDDSSMGPASLGRSFALRDMVTVVGGAIEDSYPVYKDLVAFRILDQHGFSASSVGVADAKENFLRQSCRQFEKLGEALESFGLNFERVLATRVAVGEGDSFLIRYEDPDSGQKALEITYTRADKNAKKFIYKIPVELSEHSEHFHVLAGIGRQHLTENGASIKFADLLERERNEALDGSLFKYLEGGRPIPDAVRLYIEDEKLPLEEFGVVPSIFVAGDVGGQLAEIRRPLQERARGTSIQNPVLSWQVGEKLLENYLVGSEWQGLNVRVVTEPEVLLSKVRREDLFSPLQANPVKSKSLQELIGKAPEELRLAIKSFLAQYEPEGLVPHPQAGAVRRALRFYFEQLYPITVRDKGDRVAPEKVIDLIQRLAETADGHTFNWPIYYGFMKGQSITRTGSRDGHIGFGEFEMLRRFAELGHAAISQYGLRLKFVIVDESTGIVGRLGVTSEHVSENHSRARTFLERIGGAPFVEVRGLRPDIETALGENFAKYYDAVKKSASRQEVAWHRKFVLMTCLTLPELKQLGLTDVDIKRVQSFLLREVDNEAKYPPQVIQYVCEIEHGFKALMDLRELAKQTAQRQHLAIPQFENGVLRGGVTRAKDRISIDPCEQFLAVAVLPLHGIPCYQEGKFLGHVPLWKIALLQESFSLYVDTKGNPVLAEFTLMKDVVRQYVESLVGSF